MIASLLENEEERLRELLKYEMLDTPQEQEYDDLVKLTSQICQVPISLITLVGECRQWFKAKVGVEGSETPRDIAFCAHTIRFPEMLEVEDMLKDNRFAENPLVKGEPYIRFYAGMPLISPSGHRLGTLCVLDTKPRRLTEEQRFALQTLAKQVMQQFELKRRNKSLQTLSQQYLGFYEEVKKEQEAIEKVQEAAEIGIYDIDLQKGEMKISKGYSTLFGLPPQKSFPVNRFLELVHPEDVPYFKEAFSKSIEQRFFSYEFRCIRPGTKEVIYIHCMGENLRDQTGEPIRLVGIKQNVTLFRENQAKLAAQNEELKKVNAELDNFVYRVSHDLRAPNSSILGLIDIILNQEKDPVKIRELLVLIKKSLKKQDDFIRDILDYSKNARLELNVEPIDFQKLLEEVFSQLLYTYSSENVTHFIQVNQPVPFATDKSRLRIVFNNLIGNALKYLKKRSTEGKVVVQVEVTEENALISIEDNGMGIEKKYLARVFDMFYRATDQQPGSGLGLYIVKEAVQKLGGLVELQSEAGKGTLVNIEIPNLIKKKKSQKTTA